MSLFRYGQGRQPNTTHAATSSEHWQRHPVFTPMVKAISRRMYVKEEPSAESNILQRALSLILRDKRRKHKGRGV
jgi:hypothetical protein